MLNTDTPHSTLSYAQIATLRKAVVTATAQATVTVTRTGTALLASTAVQPTTLGTAFARSSAGVRHRTEWCVASRITALVPSVRARSRSSTHTHPPILALHHATTAAACVLTSYCAPASGVQLHPPPTTGHAQGDHVPNDKTENEASGAIRDVISPGCPKYDNLVVSSLADISYAFDALGESNRSTSRLALKLELLATTLRTVMTAMGHPADMPVLVVEAAYRRPPGSASDASLHNEGRAALISLPSNIPSAFGGASQLMRYAVSSNFDWVYFQTSTQIHVSVTPDSCTAPLDLMFLLDSSGSIDSTSYGGAPGTFHDKVLGFVQAIVPYFNIGHGDNETQVGVVTFSDVVNLRIALRDWSTAAAVNTAVAGIPYDAGYTYTSAGLNAVRTQLMTPTNGLRALSSGVSRVLIVMTDGVATDGCVRAPPPRLRSVAPRCILPINAHRTTYTHTHTHTVSSPSFSSRVLHRYHPDAEAALLHQGNVNVFVMGVGQSLNHTQLNVMASSPNNVYVMPTTFPCSVSLKSSYVTAFGGYRMRHVMLRSCQCLPATLAERQ
jgi:hypothetical protein